MSDNNLEVNEKNNKKISPFIVFGLVIVVIISISIFSILSLLSPKNKFFNLLGNTVAETFREISKIEKTPIGSMFLREDNSKLKVEASISGDVKTEDENIKEWLYGFENFNVNLIQDLDVLSNYSNMYLNFLVDDFELLAGNIVKNNNLTSIKVRDITNEYITVDENNLEKLWDDSEYQGPTTITGQLDWIKNLNFTKKEMKDLKEAIITMGSAFSSNFEDTDFIEGISEVKTDEEVIECEYIDFNMYSDKFNAALISSLEKIVENDEYIDVFYKIISLLNEAYGLTPDTREEFLIQFEALINEYRAIDFNEESLSIIRLYHKDGKILKIEILAEDYNQKFLDFTMVTGKDSAYYMYKTDIIVCEDRVTNIDDKITHLITINYIDYETGGIIEELGKEITITIDNSKNNVENVKVIEKIKLVDYETLEDAGKKDGSIVKDYTFNFSNENKNRKIEAILNDFDNNFSSNFSISLDIKEDADFTVNEIAEEDNFDTTVKSKEEILNKKNEIIANWNEFSEKNSKKIEKLQTAISMYLGAFVPEISYNDDFEVR